MLLWHPIVLDMLFAKEGAERTDQYQVAAKRVATVT